MDGRQQLVPGELDDVVPWARLEGRQRVVVLVERGPVVADEPRGPRRPVDAQPDDADQDVARPVPIGHFYTVAV